MNRQRVQIVPLFLFLIIISSGLLVMDRNRITDPIRSKIEYYILRIRGGTLEDTGKREELESKIFSLENQRSDLAEENRVLRKQLQAPLPPSYGFIPSIVLSRQLNQKQSALLISTGSVDGVEVGMPVVAEQILLGTVKDVTPKMAHVQLLSDPESSIAVKTNNRARGIVFAYIESNDPTKILLDRVLLSEPLKVGDILETSGEDRLPPDLLIGTVTKLTTESRDPFQKAIVELAIDPIKLDRVFIVDNIQ